MVGLSERNMTIARAAASFIRGELPDGPVHGAEDVFKRDGKLWAVDYGFRFPWQDDDGPSFVVILDESDGPPDLPHGHYFCNGRCPRIPRGDVEVVPEGQIHRGGCTRFRWDGYLDVVVFGDASKVNYRCPDCGVVWWLSDGIQGCTMDGCITTN